MNRPKHCIVAEYGRITDARNAMNKLDRSGLSRHLVSLVSSSQSPAEATGGNACQCYQNLPAECPPACQGNPSCEWSGACVPKILQFGDNMEKDAIIGAGVGAVCGLVTGIGVATFMSGQTGFLLVPIVVISTIVAAFLGAMFGWGVHSDRLAWYERKVKVGKTLLVVHGNPLEVARANRLLMATRPATMCLHGENSADDLAICSR